MSFNSFNGQKTNTHLQLLVHNPEIEKLQCDTANLLKMAKAINRQNSERPIEKVYLHIDKPSYSRGDTIWYKAYLTIGADHKFSTLSSVLYCELIDDKDSVIQRSTLRVKNGVSWGSLALSKHYQDGIYHLRAYTNWMRNHSSAYFYNRRIVVGNVNKSALKNYTYLQPDVQFFPEGGVLVNGLRNRVAFKAIGSKGYGLEAMGYIIDKDGNEVVSFKTQHLGMGEFAFTPERGNNYIAKMTAGNHTFFVKIPKIHDDGFTLSINSSFADSLAIRVTSSKNSFAALRHSPLYIIAQSESKVYFATTFNLEEPNNVAHVDKSRFPTGIVQFTLFSSSGVPLNERIVFVNKHDTLNFKLPLLNPIYSQRGKMNFDLEIKMANGMPAVGNFSVAVINENLVHFPDGDEPDIMTSLLFNSDLRGHIEQPDYYFSNKADAESSLDLLMLTQGYRKLNWKYILSVNNFPEPQYQPENSLEVNGILKTNDDQPVINGSVQLLVSTEKIKFQTTTDVNGKFKFTGLDLPEKTKITILGERENGDEKIFYQVRKFAPTEYTAKELKPAPRKDLSNSVKTKVFDAPIINQKPDFVNDGIVLDEVKIKEESKNNDCKCLVYIFSGNPNQNFKDYSFDGYSISRDFYSPKYDINNIEKRKKDIRSTVYWNPQLITDKDGKVAFNFFNSDNQGIYRIVIEGLDNYGHWGRTVLHYNVQ